MTINKKPKETKAARIRRLEREVLRLTKANETLRAQLNHTLTLMEFSASEHKARGTR